MGRPLFPVAEMEEFLLAVSFLTRCPVPLRSDRIKLRAFARSFVFFPLVGALIGGITVAFLAGCRYIFPPSISGILAVALILWFTRALHLDGFADWIDGLGGGYTPERRREIMKDSRIGVFGAASVAIIIALKAFALASLQELGAWQAIIMSPLCGRFAMVFLAWRAGPCEQNKGLGARFIEGFSWKILLVSSLWFIPFLIYSPLFSGLAVSITVISVLLLKKNYTSCFGTVSGDLFGATSEVVETEVLLAGIVSFRVLFSSGAP